MKAFYKRLALAFCLILIQVPNSFLLAGEGGSTGGSFEKLKAAALTNFLNSDLLIIILQKHRQFFNLSDLYRFGSNGPALSSRFQKFHPYLSQEIQYIKDNKFDLSGPCYEKDENGIEQEVDASTLDNIRNAKICINLQKIIHKDIYLSYLIGIIIHEIAHHYGDKDKDHTLAFAVASTAPVAIERATIRLSNREVYFFCEYLKSDSIKTFLKNSLVTNDLCPNYK